LISSDYYNNALQEADSPNCSEAIVLDYLQIALNDGDERAAYAMAQCYRYGTFGSKIDVKAAHDLNRTLEHSNIAEAVFNLAFDYDCGNFVRKNSKRAFSLYLVAGLLGDPESCAQVSQAYRLGWVVPQNKALAKAWRERSKCDAKLIAPPYRRWLR
jgi:TPR repeat protein